MPVILIRRSGSSGVALSDLLAGLRLDEAVLVVPTRRRIRHLSRELLDRARRGVAPALPIHTLESFATAVYRGSPDARPLVAGTAQTLLFDAAVRSIAGSLRYFRTRPREPLLFPGTFDRLIAIILHLKDSGVSPGMLLEEADGAPLDERQKLRDVAEVYRAYNERLAAAGLTDIEGVFSFFHGAAGDEVERVFRASFPNVRTLSLAGFDEFTAPQLSFLRTVTAVPGVSSSVLFDYQHGNAPLFGHLEDNYERLIEFGFREESRPDTLLDATAPPRPSASRDATDLLSARLFARPPLERTDLSDRISVIRGDSRVNEVQRVCTVLRTLMAARPERDLSAICVAMTRPDLYTDILREQCRRFGIPVNITDRFWLSRSPVVIAVLGLVLARTRGFRRDDLLRVLSSPYFNFGSGEDPIDVSNLESVSRELRIGGGLKSWLDRIDARIRELESPDAAREPGTHDADVLRKARKDIERIREATDSLARPLPPAEFREALTDLLGKLQVAIRLVSRAGAETPEQRERDVRAFARFLEVVDDVVAMVSLRDGAANAHPPAFYVDQLRVAVARERYNVYEQFGRGVLVTSVEETRGLSIEVMIVIGLVDGEFPSVYQTEVFLSEQRQALRRKRHEWRQRYLFYQAVTNWSERLYLCYPELADDVETVRSTFLDAIDDVARVSDLDPLAGADGRPVLCADDDVLAWHARYGALEGGPAVPARLDGSLRDIRRIIDIERSRQIDHRMPEYEGRIGGALTGRGAARLASLRSRTWSISQLETYAACPFRFFAARMLDAAALEEYREDLSPLERGRIIHEELNAFFAARRAHDLPSLRECTEEEFRAAVEDLIRRVAGRFDRLGIPDPFWEIDRASFLGRGPGRPGILEELLLYERGRDVESRPTYFELAFGTSREGDGDSATDAGPILLGDIRLQGRVDRVDTGPDFFTIVDYKTGARLPGLKDIREGLSLQLPVYLQAINRMPGETAGKAPAAALYVQLRHPLKVRAAIADPRFRGRAFTGSEAGRQSIRREESMEEVLGASVEAVGRIVDGIVAGRFPLVEQDRIEDECGYCAYLTSCRIQAARHVRQKEGD